MATSKEVFEQRTAEYESTLNEILSLGGTLTDFREEYEKLRQALEKSYESDTRLFEKTQDLSRDIEAQKEKYETAKREEEDLALQKQQRQEEIKRVWKEVEEIQETEATTRTKLEDVKSNIECIKIQISKGSGWSDDQEKQFLQLRKTREELEATLNQRVTNLQTMRQDVQIFTETVSEAELKKLALEKEVDDLEQSIKLKESQCTRATERKNLADIQLKEKKSAVEQYQTLLLDKKDALTKGKQEIAHLESRFKSAKAKMEHYLRDYDALFHQTHRLTEDLDEQVRLNTYLQSELEKRKEEVEKITKEIKYNQKDIARVNKLKDHTLKKIEALNKKQEKIRKKRDNIKEATKQFENEAGIEKKENDTLAKQVSDLSREREILNKSLIKADDRTKQAIDLIAMYVNTKRNLENEIQAYKGDALTDRQVIEQLEEDVSRYEREAAEANQRYFTGLEEVKLQETHIADLQRKIIDAETKLKQQQNLYEAVRSDRNLYSKSLIESQDEISEMKRKFKIMNHQIEQLKEEITSKDHTLVKEHFDHHKVEKEKETLKNELTKIKKQIQSSEQITANQDSEIKKLSQIINDAQEEWTKQQKEYEAVVSERDILGSQLIRRNEELSSLYEKIKIQKSSLNKGEGQYTARKRLIQDLSDKLEGLNKELTESQDQVKNIGDMEREIIKLDRDLMQERSKVKALSEELERPLNVHRWRKLEGSDPQRYEMLQKIQSLQKRIIKKTEEVVQTDSKIQEKEKLYLELKTVLARQPGSEVSEQLEVYQQNLKDKVKHSKAMKAELKMYQAQVDELKYEIDGINQNMSKMRQQYFRIMREKRQEEDEDYNFTRSEDEDEEKIDFGYSSDEEEPIRATNEGPAIEIPTVASTNES